MHIFVHIGDHKTGTTSIQAFLRQRAGCLAAAGIYVPEAGTYADDSGHHNILFDLIKDRRCNPQDGGLLELLAELRRSRSPRAVISCEDFSLLVGHPNSMWSFESALRQEGHTLTWLMFLRRVDDFSESLYCELLRSRHYPSFGYPGFALHSLFRGHYGNKYFDYAEFARQWRCLSDFPLRLYDYDLARAGDGVLPRFLSAIGAPEVLIRSSASQPSLNRQNPSCLRRFRSLFRPLLMARFHRSNQGLLALESAGS